ncbi:MAG: CerR family C-terminal domain-containing protein [Clostridiaceae bacterium]|jgi:AcrR family transcriptional regulator|nr:CerR family C-terminal domain-containing protein [Clostridiaceae bacterium]
MQTKKSENKKEKILKTAIKLFAKKGFAGTSIREICKEASTSLSMISYYWGGKKELYQGILDNLFEMQTKLAETFLDLKLNPFEMTHEKQVETLKLIANRTIDFFYSNISNDLILFLVKEQQNKDFVPKSPMFSYLRKLIAGLLNKDENDREVIFKMLFFMAQINSPRVLPAFSLRQLNQEEFTQDDIEIIRKNLNDYIDLIAKGI